MTLGEKLDVLISRKGYKKTDFAKELGITYRALANYSSGSRKPRGEVMKKIEEKLNVDRDFLLDDRRSLILSSEERFFQGLSEESRCEADIAAFISHSRSLFGGSSLTEEDKQSLFMLISEIYFDAQNKKEKI